MNLIDVRPFDLDNVIYGRRGQWERYLQYGCACNAFYHWSANFDPIRHLFPYAHSEAAIQELAGLYALVLHGGVSIHYDAYPAKGAGKRLVDAVEGRYFLTAIPPEGTAFGFMASTMAHPVPRIAFDILRSMSGEEYDALPDQLAYHRRVIIGAIKSYYGDSYQEHLVPTHLVYPETPLQRRSALVHWEPSRKEKTWKQLATDEALFIYRSHDI